MWRRFWQVCWIILVLDWRCIVFGETTDSPALNLKASANGKMDPDSIEIFSTIMDEIIAGNTETQEFPDTLTNSDYIDLFEDSSSETSERRKLLLTDDELSMKKTDDDSKNIQDVFQSQSESNFDEVLADGLSTKRQTTGSVDDLLEQINNPEANGHPTTTEKSADLPDTRVPSPETKVDPGNPSTTNNSLFLDMDKAESDLQSKAISTTDESAKDVVVNELEKNGVMGIFGGETAEELLDIKKIPSDSQILENLDVVTEINVQESVDGQMVQRKPTMEELLKTQHPNWTKDFEQDNGIFSQINKTNTTIQDQESIQIISLKNSSTSEMYVPEDVDDLASFFKSDPGFADDDSDLFGEQSDGYDFHDMEMNLDDDENRMPDQQRFKENEAPSGSGEFRKFYHTESKNFSTVNEVNIMIDESEGDLFEDEMLLQNSAAPINEFDLIKQILDGDNTNTLTDINNYTEKQMPDFVGTTTIPEINLSSTDLPEKVEISENKTESLISATESSILQDITTTKILDYKNISENEDNNDSSNDIPSTEDSLISIEPKITFPFITTDTVKDIFATDISETSQVNEISMETFSTFPVTTEQNHFSEEATVTQIPMLTQENIASTVVVAVVTTQTSLGSEASTAGEILAENGISVKDLSVITSLTENSYHDLKSADIETNLNEPRNITLSANENVTASTESVVEDVVTEKETTISAITEFTDITDEDIGTLENSRLENQLKIENINADLNKTGVSKITTQFDSENVPTLVYMTEGSGTGEELEDETKNLNLEKDFQKFSGGMTESSPTESNTVIEFVTIPGDTSTVEINADQKEEATTILPNTFKELERMTTSMPQFSTISTQVPEEEIYLTDSDQDKSYISIAATESVTELEEKSTFYPETVDLVVVEEYSTQVAMSDHNEENVEDNTNIKDLSETLTTTTYKSVVDVSENDNSKERITEFTTEAESGNITELAVSAESTTQSLSEASVLSEAVTGASMEDTHEYFNPSIIKEVETMHRELTPSEVALILNGQMNENDSDEDDDYDSKEQSSDVHEEDKISSNKEKEQHFSVGEEEKKLQLTSDSTADVDHFEENNVLATIGENGHRVEMVPLLRNIVLNNSAEFSIKIGQKAGSFYVPSSAHIKEYANIVNITWRTNENQNNSVALRIFEKEEFYMIKEIMTNIFTGNKFVSQQKAVALNPDSNMDDTMTGRARMVVMKDGTYVTFSNVEFLKKISENSEAIKRSEKLWHFEVASICIATVLVLAIVVYVIAIKTKARITLREKDELPQVTHC